MEDLLKRLVRTPLSWEEQLQAVHLVPLYQSDELADVMQRPIQVWFERNDTPYLTWEPWHALRILNLDRVHPEMFGQWVLAVPRARFELGEFAHGRSASPWLLLAYLSALGTLSMPIKASIPIENKKTRKFFYVCWAKFEKSARMQLYAISVNTPHQATQKVLHEAHELLSFCTDPWKRSKPLSPGLR